MKLDAPVLASETWENTNPNCATTYNDEIMNQFIASGSFSFNADDELASESYDQNGNVTVSGGKSFSYNSQNQLVTMTATGTSASLVYDAFGNRVSKTVNGVTTSYLVDDLNPTGYPQVIDELTGAAVTRTYTYGLQRIDEDQQISSVWTPSFYGYDGGGNVRQLTSSAGTVTDTYEYDAFGSSFTISGSTPNEMMYRGEQYDSDLGLDYLRARYYNPLTGRFMSKDPLDGNQVDPKSLHRYLCAGGDPVNALDPSGRDLEEYVTIIIKNNYIGKGKVAYQFGKCIGDVYGEIGDNISLLAGNSAQGKYTSSTQLTLNILHCVLNLLRGAKSPPKIPAPPSLGSD